MLVWGDSDRTEVDVGQRKLIPIDSATEVKYEDALKDVQILN